MSQSWWKLLPHFVLLDHPQLSSRSQAPTSEAPGWLTAVAKIFCETGRSRRLAVLSLAVMTLGLVIPASAQTVFNCSSFASSGTCGITNGSGQAFGQVGGNLLGSAINLTPSGSAHNSYNAQYMSYVNVQAFATTFTFVPNGYNLAFVIQNCNDAPGQCPGAAGVFVSGAGSEGGFFQGGGGPNTAPNNVWALQLDSYDPLTSTTSFVYSSAQIYQTLQAPFTTGSYGASALASYVTNKLSTSPVPLNSPSNSPGTTTGDTYSATISYDGNTVTLTMYDVTAGGSCPGASCFTQSWSGVYIPSIVDGTNAVVGFSNGVGENPTTNLLIKSWSYTVNTPTGTPTYTAWNANSTYNTGSGSASSSASPVYSVAPGTYSSAQSVSMTTSTSPNNYICYVLSSTVPTYYPQPDNNGGCNKGTLYTGAVTISSTATLYAMAGNNNSAFALGSINATGIGPPSTLVAGTYTITGGGAASTPTFSPAAGSYTTAQSVTISDATSGATIYYTANGTTPTTSSTQYTGPITVSSTETLQAIAVATGDTNSAVASAAYTMTPTVATPTFSPAAGSYTTAQSVTISGITSGATIYYTTNGTMPTTSSTPYTGPITVSSTETLQAIAVATGDTNSAVASATYTITPTVSTPVFSPAAGSYTSAQSVSISDATSGATIYYTTNGATPTTSSTRYTGPLTVSSTETLEAIAVATGDTNSAVASATYAITPTVSTPAFSLAAGTYNSAQSVSISDATSGATIYYTTNGTTPTTSSTPYSGPIMVSSTETLEAIAVATGDTNSVVASATYTITPTVSTPSFSPAAGTYTSAQSVSISDATSGATIYYTTNGTTPTTSSTQYTSPITVSSTETLEAIAVATGDTNSGVASATYTITPVVSTPSFSPAAGTFSSAQSVSISDTTSGVTIYYTTNGTTPTTSSPRYTGPITVSTTETLEAIAVATGDTNSAVASAAYTITPVVSTPSFSPAAGTFSSAQSVSISDTTSGATIYYTTNGSTPTTSSTQYTGPITVSATEALEAIAVATGDTNSAVASATYTITPTVSTPTFSPAAGSYTSSQSVSISDATSGATIYYTTNGSTPTTSSTRYTGPVTVSATETLEAIAVATGDTNSAVASATYTITPTVSTPAFSLAAGSYTSAQSVSISDATSGATIYYTTNGTTPTTSSTRYTGPITVSSTETLEAIAAATADPSAVASATYTITPIVSTPAFSPAAGTYTSAQSVTISDITSGATIYYTTNGSAPTTSSTRYTGPITVSSTETLEAIAVATGDTNSAAASAAYTISSQATVSTPTFSPAAGTYTSAQSVAISDATPGATIYYTTNGSAPTTSSTAYAGPIAVSSTETLEAIAVATGDTNSAVASVAYTISSQATVSTPTFSPAAGTYTSAQAVSLSDATSGATIYYTTNGATPTTSSTMYTGPIAVSSTETLEAIAVATGDTNSAVASAAYTISSSASQPTNFAIGTTVQQSAVKHLGINIGGQDYYDSGQLSRNLTVRNPGFEAEMWSSILNCQAATATTCTDSDSSNVWPANFLAGATFQVIYGAAKGQTGTITGNTVASSSANTGITLTFATPLSPAPTTGDVIQVRMQVPGNPQAGWWVSASGGATFSADTTDLSPETPGKQALSVNASASGQSALVNSYFDLYNGRSFVQLNGTYTLTFRAKAVSGSNQINVSFGRLATPAHGNVSYLSENVTLTNQWQDYSYTFNAAEDGTYVGTAALTFSVQGAQVYLDDVALTEPASADNPTAFRNAVVDTLKTLQPGVLRYMDGGADFASTTDNMIAVPFARLRAGYEEGQTEQDDISLGLHDFLVLCQTIGAEPWYTVPAGISSADMQNLIQYLAGDVSTPYGTIRATLGQSAPWTSVFPTIHLELGNEMWNSGSFAGEAIPNPVAYGSVASTAFAAARASSSYDAGKFDLVMGSWAAQPNWTAQELQNSSGYDSIDAAPYLFNSLNDYGSNEAIFGPMFAQPEQVDSSPTASGNYMYQQAQAAAAGNPPAKLAVYEVNLSTTSGTAPQSVVNQAAAGVGAGIAVADHMLLMMRDLGITTQNMFALPEYVNGFNNTQGGTETVPLWGSVIDMGGETNLKRPQFFALQLANSAIFPTMLATTVSGANPTWTQPQSTNDSIQLASAHYLQSFAFTNGTQNSVVVFNLSRSGSLPITFSGTNAPSGNVVITQLTSPNPTDNNEGLFTNNPVVAGPTQTNAGNFNPANPYSLPPYSMAVFSTGGAVLPASTTTLEASPTSANAGQSVTLTATVTSQSGTNTPTGTVTFYNGSTSLGTAPLGASGTATLSITTLTAGSDPITASYGGDNNDAASTSTPVTVTISAAVVATNTVLTASATAINSGQSVIFTATVSPQSGANVATGTVTFLDGNTSLGTATLNASGVATFTTTTLAAGTQSISASYAGDTKDSSSVSNAVSVVVTQATAGTTTTLTASAAQITIGQNVTFTAAVVAQTGKGVPTGSITFLDGTTSLGSASLNASGTATFSTTGLTAGTHSITASYSGDSGDNSSVSNAVSVVVTQSVVSIATTTTLSASAKEVIAGQSVTFTASVSPQAGSNLPTGTVSFLDGTNTLGTSSLNGTATATFTTTNLAAGTHSIVASYGGDSKDGSSVSSAVTVTVISAPQGNLTVLTTTTLTSSATQLTVGQSDTFTATIVAQSGNSVATGVVTFLDGSTSLGIGQLNASGVATFTASSLAAGAHSISASYGGDTSHGPSTSAVIQVNVAAAAAPAYAMVVDNSTVTLTPGQPSTLMVTLIPLNGFNLPIALKCTGMPQGATCAFSPANVTPSGAPVFSTVTVSAPEQNGQWASTTGTRAMGRGGNLVLGWVVPWGFIPLLGLARRRSRSQIARWSFRVAVAAALTAGSLWVSGCGYSAKASTFAMTITASASNAETHSAQITVNIQP
jgi:Bacterial Ig-like domain (group 3)/Chitobiase/beta-hexosaminidase C-terminal domain